MFRSSLSWYHLNNAINKTKKKIFQIDPWPPTVQNNNNNNNSIPSQRNFNKLVQSKSNSSETEHELIILVDTSSLLYRRAYSYLNERSYQQHLQQKQPNANSRLKKSDEKDKHGFEIDPTKWLHSNLAHSMKFIHSVIPFGDGDEKFQPDLVSAEILEEGLKCGKVKHSGGLMKRGAKELAYLAKMKGYDLPLLLQEDFSCPATNNNDASNSLLKRRIYFCFDHHDKKPQNNNSSPPIVLERRIEILEDYKGNRKQSKCGRVISFVNYGGALIRQLASSSHPSRQLQEPQLVHACFPTQMAKIENSSFSFTSNETIEKYLQSEGKDDKKSSPSQNRISNLILQKDSFLKSLYAAATNSSAFGIDECYQDKKTKNNYAIRGEADDVIYTLTKYFSELNNKNMSISNEKRRLYSVLIISGDKDLLQLLEFPNTYFFNLPNNKFISRSEACAKFSVSSPCQIADVLTLMGDAVDNVRGLPETGQKRAAQIVKKYGSVENFVRHVTASLENNRKFLAQKIKKQKIKTSKRRVRVKGNKNKVADDHDDDTKLRPVEYVPLLDEKEPKRYEKQIFQHVAKHGEQIMNIKKHVIELQELPWIRDSAMKEEEVRRRNDEDSVAATDFSRVPNSKYHFGFEFFSSRPIAPRTARAKTESKQKDLEVCFTPLSSKKISESFWNLIRKYYSKKIGVCDKNNEGIHNCGVRKRK